MKSPCRKICKIVDDVCIGCNRTLYEVAAWSRLTNDQRQAIMETLDNPRRIEDGLELARPGRRRTNR